MACPCRFQLNLLGWARGKNRKNVNRSSLNCFKTVLTTFELKVIHLQNTLVMLWVGQKISLVHMYKSEHFILKSTKKILDIFMMGI
jgi:hypothetical protein